MSKSTKGAVKQMTPKEDAPQPQLGNKAKEKMYQITEGAANALLGQISKLPWDVANPLILTIQKTFVLVEDAPQTEG